MVKVTIARWSSTVVDMVVVDLIKENDDLVLSFLEY
jgi:hypothetical protein